MQQQRVPRPWQQALNSAATVSVDATGQRQFEVAARDRAPLWDAMTGDACSQPLAGGASAATWRTCLNATPHEPCADCLVVKAKLPGQRQRVNEAEAHMLRLISAAVPEKDPYYKHVLQYYTTVRFLAPPVVNNRWAVAVSAADNPIAAAGDFWLFTRALPPCQYRDMDQLLKAALRESRLTEGELWGLIAQVFATLAHLQDKVPGFLHMDIKPSNVALVNADAGVGARGVAEALPLRGGAYHLLIAAAGRRFDAVVIDFGLSLADTEPGNLDIFQSHGRPMLDCFTSGFDVFRMVHSLVHHYGPANPVAAVVGRALQDALFGGDAAFNELSSPRYTSPLTFMLNESGCQRMNSAVRLIQRYDEVLFNTPALRAHIHLARQPALQPVQQPPQALAPARASGWLNKWLEEDDEVMQLGEDD